MTEERRRRDTSREAGRAEPTCDRVFVHDLVLDVEIGVYTHEKGVTQRVRFSVDIDVTAGRAVAVEDNIERVLDYDMIIGAIKSIVASGHIHLAETLAEEVAARALPILARAACQSRSRSSTRNRAPWAWRSCARGRGRER